MTHYSTDIKFVTNFFKGCNVFFSAPVTLILSQVFLYNEVGVYSFTLLIIMVISLIIQFLIDLKMASLQLKKLGHYQERINSNMEMFSAIR
jgi:hypothetical protein